MPALAYQQEMRVDYEATVRLGYAYLSSPLKPEQLPSWQAQAEPRVIRRAVLYEVLDRLWFEVPWRVEYDRPVQSRGVLRIDGLLAVPRVWQKRIPLLQPTEVTSDGRLLAGQGRFVLDMRHLRAEMQNALAAGGISPGSVDLQVRAELTWEAPGHGSDSITHEFVVAIIGSSHVEIEEKQPVSASRTIRQTVMEPLTIATPLGQRTVEEVRRTSVNYVAGLLFPAGAAWLVVGAWGRIRLQPAARRRLSGAVLAETIRIPHGAALIQVEALAEMVRLHAATEKPLIQTPGAIYLLDGPSCFYYTLQAHRYSPERENAVAAALQSPEEEPRPWA